MRWLGALRVQVLENAVIWKSLYRYRPEGIFRIFFGLILDPPRYICFYSAKKGKFICTGHFFPHGMAFLEKRGGGLVPVHVFIFPGHSFLENRRLANRNL